MTTPPTKAVLNAVKREYERDAVQNQGLTEEDLVGNTWDLVREESGVFEFFCQTQHSFNLAWSVYAFVSDYMTDSNLAELRGIVVWLEGEMTNVEIVDASI